MECLISKGCERRRLYSEAGRVNRMNSVYFGLKSETKTIETMERKNTIDIKYVLSCVVCLMLIVFCCFLSIPPAKHSNAERQEQKRRDQMTDDFAFPREICVLSVFHLQFPSSNKDKHVRFFLAV